ncbi:TraX family protein [Klebsiella variicola]|uniref:TraX family protein n=1 Tax=Klebsiella variicola TaxID=244366 RepID=UPI003872D713
MTVPGTPGPLPAGGYRLCRATEAVERTGYALLWAVMVLLLNLHDAGQSVAGLAIALLVVSVCSDIGKQVKRFWPPHFFVLFYAVHLAVLGIVAA